jgi:hypothetical protein
MKLLKSIIFLSVFTIGLIANTDKKNIEVVETLYEKVILKDIEIAINDATILKKELENKNTQKIKEEFSKLVGSWKSVESFYILGDLDEEYIDTPRYIDIFHNGNEDITKQLDRAIKSEDEIRIALFKNSLKSINALEYIIYKKDISNKRVNEISIAIINRIIMHLSDIQTAYKDNKEKLFKQIKKANSIIINRVVANSYKLKEWRVGDVMGKTKKYANKPDNSRAEYFTSKNSATAILSILQTYKEIFDNDKIYDYGDYLLTITDGEILNALKEAINNSIIEIKKIKNDDFSNADTLYEEITNIHVILFVEMIEELSINAKILDADGD